MAFTFTDENVEKEIATGKPIVVDFWATWCGPCKAIAPIIDELAAEYEGQVLIGKYNCDEENDFASANRIMSIPALLFYKDGKKTDIRMVGAQSKAAIEEKIKELIAL
ncbi:MAG: thioredoxin [Muribaculaceae bacterium]|nr:thioredoxin [Muribaculaceae bacterium]